MFFTVIAMNFELHLTLMDINVNQVEYQLIAEEKGSPEDIRAESTHQGNLTQSVDQSDIDLLYVDTGELKFYTPKII